MRVCSISTSLMASISLTSDDSEEVESVPLLAGAEVAVTVGFGAGFDS